MSLSYSRISGNRKIIDGFPIARDGNIIIYYNDNPIDILREEDLDEVEDLVLSLVDDVRDKLGFSSISTQKLIDIDNDIISKDDPTDRRGKKIVAKVKDELGAMESKFYRARSQLRLIPMNIQNQTSRMYTSGDSGAGKTFLAAQYAKEYLEEDPTRRVFLISGKNYDPSIDPILPDLIRVRLDRNFIKNVNKGDSFDQYRNSLVIFDDFYEMTDKTLVKAIELLKTWLLKLGRQYDTNIISIQHKGLNGKQSSTELSECNYIIVFPKTNPRETEEILKKYLLFKGQTLNRILDEEGKLQRWMCIKKPNIIITENYIKIID
jgi:hypothetical protein